MEKWNQIKDPELHPHIYGYLIFYKEACNTHWGGGGGRQHFQQLVLVTVDALMQKNANRSRLITLHKMQLRMDQRSQHKAMCT
jgi:hypothetical protein